MCFCHYVGLPQHPENYGSRFSTGTFSKFLQFVVPFSLGIKECIIVFLEKIEIQLKVFLADDFYGKLINEAMPTADSDPKDLLLCQESPFSEYPDFLIVKPFKPETDFTANSF